MAKILPFPRRVQQKPTKRLRSRRLAAPGIGLRIDAVSPDLQRASDEALDATMQRLRDAAPESPGSTS